MLEAKIDCYFISVDLPLFIPQLSSGINFAKIVNGPCFLRQKNEPFLRVGVHQKQAFIRVFLNGVGA